MNSDRKYALGIDFGTLSARAVLVDVGNGKEIASWVEKYHHKVMYEYLIDPSINLPPNYSLQHPNDYMDVLSKIVPNVINYAKISSNQIIGIGIAFTSCTILPIKNNGTPLCLFPEFHGNKHAYAKLWKHHAAMDYASKINQVAIERNESFLLNYGSKVSSEWFFPKVWQILDESLEVFNAADKFIEAGDWIVMMLTGNDVRSSCFAGYKAFWDIKKGFPSKDFFKALDVKLENIIEDKLSYNISPPGTKAGVTNLLAKKLTGLSEGIPVSVASIDAHSAAPSCGLVDEGKMLLVMGTSICHLVLSKDKLNVPGMTGVVGDGIIPGFYGYESGQSCVGDLFDWFVKNFVPAHYSQNAIAQKITIHKYLRQIILSRGYCPSGLIALDWWNGNRSVLMDEKLSGLIIGMNLSTKPEDIYLSLLEATAYGTRKIIEAYEQSGFTINELVACGGIASKDSLMMQIYADVTGKNIKVVSIKQPVAFGASMFGAVSAGSVNHGYDNIVDATKAMCNSSYKTYIPNMKFKMKYDLLYNEYLTLHDYFGKGQNDVMKRLIDLNS